MIKLFICLHYGSFRFHLNVSNNNLQCIHVFALLIYLAEQSLGGYCIVDLLGWSADQSAISLCLVINQILSTNFKCTFTLLWHLNKGFVQIHFQLLCWLTTRSPVTWAPINIVDSSKIHTHKYNSVQNTHTFIHIGWFSAYKYTNKM